MKIAADNARLSAAISRRVLILDDDVDVGVLLARVVDRAWSSVVMTDARAAVARIQACERFDCITCDMRMPLMNGMEFFRAVHEIDALQSTRIIFVSGASSPPIDAFLRTVSNICISKPFSPSVVREVMNATVHAAEWPASGVWRSGGR